MAIRYHYDLYPRTDPRDGTRITRFTKLQAATYRDVIGVGSGAGVIRSTDAEADDLDPRGEQFIRVVREDTVAETEATVGGFWINNVKHETAVARQTKRLTFAGAGTMAYLARSRMAPHTYIHAIFEGQDPFDGLWRLYNQSTVFANGNYLGAMLWRVIYEAQHWRNGTPAHRHKDGLTYTDTHPLSDRLHGGVGATAIPDLVMGFDQFEDSDGNAWTAKSGEFTAAIGENVLSVVQRLMQAGLYVEMDPVTFELRAWENNDHRRDRTGGAWGANVVRFQAPTDGTVATGNMLNDSEREINSHLKRSLVWAGGQDAYAIATGTSDIPWEGFENSDATEIDALEQLAETQLTAREEAADAGSVRMKLGTTPLSGRYRPWEEVRLDDLVTLDTGSGVWDYTEDTYPVAGLRIELQKSGAWWAWAELGASQPNLSDRRFQVAPVGPHSHPPNPELCRIGVEAEASRLYITGNVATSRSEDPDWDFLSDPVPTFSMSTTPSGLADGSSTWDAVNQAAATFGLLQGTITLSNAGLLATIQSGGPIRIQNRIGIRHGIGINEAAQIQYLEGSVRVYRPGTATFIGTALAIGDATGTVPAMQDTAGTIANRSMVGTLTAVPGAVATDELVIELGTKHAGPFTGGTGGRLYWNDVEASDLPEDDSTTTELRSWIEIGGGALIGGDLPLDTVHQGAEATGTSIRAARCDHQHAHGLLSADGLHYHDADHIEGIDDGGEVPTTDVPTVELSGDASITVTDDSTHNAFPGLALMGDGNLIAVYRTGTQHSGSSQDGRIVRKISTDDGATWGSAADVANPADDARDPEVTVLTDGTVAVRYVRYNGTASGFSLWLIKSTDNGSTWGSPIQITTSVAVASSAAKIVELPNGDLICPLYGNATGTGNWSAYLVRSTDAGATWGSQVTIATGTIGVGDNWTEPYILLLSDGRLMCAIREDTDRDIYLTYSDDDGATWSTPQIAFDGWAKPFLLETATGAVVCVTRSEESDERAFYVVSWDQGQSWSDDIDLESTGEGMTYASGAQVDERIVIIYSLEPSATNGDVYVTDLLDVVDERYSNESRLRVQDGTTAVSNVHVIHFPADSVTLNADGSVSVAGITADQVKDIGRWEPVVVDTGSGPELVFSDGDIVMQWVT
jgi:hypothetical protein